MILDRIEYGVGTHDLGQDVGQVGDEPFSYVHFCTSLSHLQSTCLILLVSTKVGQAYTNQLPLLFDYELLQSTWNARFG